MEKRESTAKLLSKLMAAIIRQAGNPLSPAEIALRMERLFSGIWLVTAETLETLALQLASHPDCPLHADVRVTSLAKETVFGVSAPTANIPTAVPEQLPDFVYDTAISYLIQDIVERRERTTFQDLMEATHLKGELGDLFPGKDPAVVILERLSKMVSADILGQLPVIIHRQSEPILMIGYTIKNRPILG